MANIEWTIENVEADSVRLYAAPVKGIIPDGVRVRVLAINGEDNRKPQREASVQHVDPDGNRSDEVLRFGRAGVEASGGFSSSCEDRLAYWRDGVELDAPEPYWWPRHTYVKRAEGFWVDLPEGAQKAFRDVMASAAKFVGDQFPELWAGAEVRDARRALASAEGDLEKAREAVKQAKKRLRAAEREQAKQVQA